MAPSTDQFLYYIYGKGSGTALLILILVNTALVSAMLLLACTFCNKFRTKEVNLIKNRGERPQSELKKVIIHTNNGMRETYGKKNGAITTGTEGNSEIKEEENTMTVSVRVKNGTVLGSVKREPDETPPLMHRVLPLPPENLQEATPAAEIEDPLYTTVKEVKEQLAETRQHNVRSNEKHVMSMSKTAPENQEALTLERINPLYVPAEEVEGSPFYRETTCDLPSCETNEKDDDGKIRVVSEPLYAVVRKEASMKKPPQKPGGEKTSVKDSVLQKVVLPEKLNNVDQTVHFVTSVEEKPAYPQSPVDKVDSMLTYWKKRSVKSTQTSKEDMKSDDEVPPLVPVKRFDIESEIEQHIIEEEKA